MRYRLWVRVLGVILMLFSLTVISSILYFFRLFKGEFTSNSIGDILHVLKIGNYGLIFGSGLGLQLNKSWGRLAAILSGLLYLILSYATYAEIFAAFQASPLIPGMRPILILEGCKLAAFVILTVVLQIEKFYKQDLPNDGEGN